MPETIVKIDKLVKRYKELVAVDHLSLEIKEGEVFGLLGPNGSGKTTTINCLLSLLSFDKGDISIFGKPMSPTAYDIKSNIGVVMQNVAVFEELTVRENIDYFCGLYIKDKEKRRKLVNEAIAFTGLEEFEKFHPKKLSGGLLRRLNIACGIAHKPRLIIFDEPTVAVDPQSRNKILEGIIELNKQGATVIYTSHYMEEVEQICSKIAIMDKGRLITQGTLDELRSNVTCSEKITVGVRDADESILDEIRELDHVFEATLENGELVVKCSGGKHNVVRLLTLLQEQNIHIGKVTSEQPTLNTVFLELTGKELRDKN
ncbi:MAG: ABC transporter ATP-binding protein [Ruminococcus sp.]|nr:ABC transporter ATP-binding protein [Ruminococcus sp.]